MSEAEVFVKNQDKLSSCARDYNRYVDSLEEQRNNLLEEVNRLQSLLKPEPICKTRNDTKIAKVKNERGGCKLVTPCPDCKPEPSGGVAELKKFPLLGDTGNIGSIPWWVAEQAYIVYASKYGDQQSLERLAERGGFGIEEMDEYYPRWREKCSLIAQLKSQLADSKQEADVMWEGLNGSIAELQAEIKEQQTGLNYHANMATKTHIEITKLKSQHANFKAKVGELQGEIEGLREITNIKDPEQHFEQIMEANKELHRKLAELKEKVKLIQNGDYIEMPPFEAKLPLSGQEINTLEIAYLTGWTTALLTCGEILSKPAAQALRGQNPKDGQKGE